MSKLNTRTALIIFLVLVSLTPLLNYEELGYYGYTSFYGLFLLYSIFFTIILGIKIANHVPLIKNRIIRKNIIINIMLFWVPFIALTLIFLLALMFYKNGLPLDQQPYLEIFENIPGKVVIHLLPAGIIYKLYNNEINKKLLLTITLLVIAYVYFYNERLYIIPFVAIIILHGFRKKHLNTKAILLYTILLVVIFVTSELVRSFLSSNISSGNMSFADSIEYALKRLPLYYADPVFKSASCLEENLLSLEPCSNKYWESSLLTNRGAVSELIPLIPYPLILLLALLLGFFASYTSKTHEIDKKPNWMLFFSPYFFTAIIEFPRFGYFLLARFWLVFFILFFILLISKNLDKEEAHGRS